MIAAWADISDALTAGDPAVLESAGWGLAAVSGVVSKVNIGYFWMMVNCFTSAAYVSSSLIGSSAHLISNNLYRY